MASANPIYIHLGWNNWNPVVSPDGLMTLNTASNWWEYSVTVPLSATQLDCVFNNGLGAWDNNNGTDWHFTVATNSTPQLPPQPQNFTVTPVQTNQINLAWSASFGATGYIVNRDNSPIATTTATNYSDIGLTANTYYCYSIVASNNLGFSTPSVTICTNTPVNVQTNYPPFAIDGAFDSPGYLLASNSMVLYAALRGTTLYVATGSPGISGPNDCFIFVTDQLLSSASASAPWAKSGNVAVATTKPYLAGESQNSYISWYANGAQTNWPCAKAATTSGAMEGTINLVQAFGYMPTNIYLCAAAYATADGGSLVAQSPAGSGANIETNEFFVIPTTALADLNANGTSDLLEPALGFKLLNVQLLPGSYVLNWASMPGHSYQVDYADLLGGLWSDLTGASNTAGPLQLIMAYTDAPPTTVTQRFYRVKLLP